MDTLEKHEFIKKQKLVEERNLRIARQKEDSHRNFLIGETFTKHVGVATDIRIHKGKDAKAKNAASMESLGILFDALGKDEKLMEWLKKEIARNSQDGF